MILAARVFLSPGPFLKNPRVADPPIWDGSMTDLTIHELSGLSQEGLRRELRKEVQGIRGTDPKGNITRETVGAIAPSGKRAAGKGTAPTHGFSPKDLFLKVFTRFIAQSLRY